MANLAGPRADKPRLERVQWLTSQGLARTVPVLPLDADVTALLTLDLLAAAIRLALDLFLLDGARRAVCTGARRARDRPGSRGGTAHGVGSELSILV